MGDFLQLLRESYLLDVIDVLIVAFLFFVPLLVGPDAGTLATSIFLFLIWTALIIYTTTLIRGMRGR